MSIQPFEGRRDPEFEQKQAVEQTLRFVLLGLVGRIKIVTETSFIDMTVMVMRERLKFLLGNKSLDEIEADYHREEKERHTRFESEQGEQA